MSDPHDPGAPRRAEDDVRRDEVGADDPFNRRRPLDDANIPPEYRETGRGEGIAGERGITPVAGRFSSDQAKMAGVVAMVGGAALLLFLTWDRGDARNGKEQPKEPARQVVSYDQVAKTPPPPLPPAPTAGPGPGIDPLTGQPLAAGQVVPAPSPYGAQGATAGGTRESLADLSRRAPIMAFSATGGGQLGNGYAAAVPANMPLEMAAPRTPTELENLRRGSTINTARAKVLGDRSYMILAGTQIPCVLQTAMDSSLPGYTTCIIPRDVYPTTAAWSCSKRAPRSSANIAAACNAASAGSSSSGTAP